MRNLGEYKGLIEIPGGRKGRVENGIGVARV